MGTHSFTWLRWYNSAPDEHGKCAKVASADVGSYAAIPYGTTRTGEVHAASRPPHPDHGQWQWGIALSRTSLTLVVDVDDADAYALSDLELALPVREATSYRITPDARLKFHFVVVVPPELSHLWPRQGSTPWGDIKSNGFSYVTGVHHTGTEYVASANLPVEADEELLRLLIAEPRAQSAGSSRDAGAGDWGHPAYAYAMGEKWNRGVADTASMVNQGLPDTDILALMTAILQRSEGYAGHGEEVAGWIESARRKYGIAEGEDWADGLVAESDAALAHLFGAETWQRRKAALAALSSRQVAALEYLADPVGWAVQPPGYDDDEPWVLPRVPDLRAVSLDQLIFPGGEASVEPGGSSDAYLGRMVFERCGHVVRYAPDAGVLLRNAGEYWYEWGDRSGAQANAKALVVAFGRGLKKDAQVEREREELLAARQAAWAQRQQAGQLTEDERNDPPSLKKLPDDEEEAFAERLKRLGKCRQRFTSSDGVNAVASMFMTEARISAETSMVADLDAEPDVLWAGGYPWSLRSPAPALAEGVNPVHLKHCAVMPVPGPHPLFTEALSQLFPAQEVREWALREIAGVVLWGETSKQHPVLEGKPNAGKSTVTDTIRRVLGNYAVDADPDKLIGGRDSSATEEEKAAMIGARMVLLDEPPKRDRQSVSQFNRIASGTGEIAAAAKYKGRVSAPKRFNLVINQNARNRLKLDAEGVRQRIVFIPAAGHIEEELFIRYRAGIQAEYPAILATLLRECALYHTSPRLPVPLAAQMALDAAYAEGDEFSQWIEEAFEVRPPEKFTKRDEDLMPGLDKLRRDFADHARALEGVRALTRAEVRDRLAALGITVKEYGGSTGKRHNVVMMLPLPEAFPGVPAGR